MLPEKFKSYQEEYKIPESTAEEVFQEYTQLLDLMPEDFDKKILDVGSGSAKFAKWAKEHRISSEIYSLEPKGKPKEKSKATKGQAENIPFKDESFDLVISAFAVPFILADDGPEVMEGKIKQSLSEMLRVTKKGGEVRFGPIINGKSSERKRHFREALNKAMKELENKQGIIVEEVPKGSVFYSSDMGGKLVREERFLIKIKKPD